MTPRAFTGQELLLPAQLQSLEPFSVIDDRLSVHLDTKETSEWQPAPLFNNLNTALQLETLSRLPEARQGTQPVASLDGLIAGMRINTRRWLADDRILGLLCKMGTIACGVATAEEQPAEAKDAAEFVSETIAKRAARAATAQLVTLIPLYDTVVEFGETTSVWQRAITAHTRTRGVKAPVEIDQEEGRHMWALLDRARLFRDNQAKMPHPAKQLRSRIPLVGRFGLATNHAKGVRRYNHSESAAENLTRIRTVHELWAYPAMDVDVEDIAFTLAQGRKTRTYLTSAGKRSPSIANDPRVCAVQVVIGGLETSSDIPKQQREFEQNTRRATNNRQRYLANHS